MTALLNVGGIWCEFACKVISAAGCTARLACTLKANDNTFAFIQHFPGQLADFVHLGGRAQLAEEAQVGAVVLPGNGLQQLQAM